MIRQSIVKVIRGGLDALICGGRTPRFVSLPPREIRSPACAYVSLLLGLLVGLIALLPAALAGGRARAPAPSRRPRRRPSWTGGPFLTSNPSGLCLAVDPSCDTYSLTIAPPATGNYTVEITTTPSSEGDDYDLYVYGAEPAQTVGSSTSSGGHEKVTLNNPPAGTYRVSTLAWLVAPGGTYQGKATLGVATAPPPADTSERPLRL